MHISEIMTENLTMVPPTMPLTDAAKAMKDADVGALPVGVNGKANGIVTDRDIVIRALAYDQDPSVIPVSNVMTSDPVFVSDEEDVEQAMQLMRENQVRRLLVKDNSGVLRGIVSIGDLAYRVRHAESCGKTLEGVSAPAS